MKTRAPHPPITRSRRGIDQVPSRVRDPPESRTSSVFKDSSGVSEEETSAFKEVEQKVKVMRFTRSQAQDLRVLVHSRTMEESTSTSLKRIKYGDDFHAPGATIENLPEEIITNIFIRLLAKQLAQMRSVSKSWNSLISHPSFITSHLNRSIKHNNHHILLAFYDTEASIYSQQPLAIQTSSLHPKLPTDVIKLPFFNPNIVYDVIGAVNGLICYQHNHKSIYIWNPSLSSVLTLPPCHHDEISNKTNLRFGYDPKTDDYKVVKPSWSLDVEIYSMRKGTWDLLTDTFPACIFRFPLHSYVCGDGHDGHLHWLGYDDNDTNYFSISTIVAFDLGSETFCETRLPDSLVAERCEKILGVLEKKLCVISCSQQCEVWVMEEYGVPESWVKRHVFPLFFDSERLCGFTSRNEFFYHNSRHIGLYDPVTKKSQIINNDPPLSRVCLKMVEYVDSLLWVTPPKHDEVDKLE